MGTTLTMTYMLWPDLYVVHAGDSRCYLIRVGGAFGAEGEGLLVGGEQVSTLVVDEDVVDGFLPREKRNFQAARSFFSSHRLPSRRRLGDGGDSVPGLALDRTGVALLGLIVLLGSGVLVHELMKLRLVDGYKIFLHPLILGTGKRLFRDLPAPQRLELVSATPTSTGTPASRPASAAWYAPSTLPGTSW